MLTCRPSVLTITEEERNHIVGSCLVYWLQLCDISLFPFAQSAVVDLKTKEEKDAELDKRIEALRKKNEALVKRYQVNLDAEI